MAAISFLNVWSLPDRFQTFDEQVEQSEQIEQSDVEQFQPGVYRHYKGAHYLAIGLAREDASNEPVVVYTRLYERDGLPLSTRTLKAWNELVAVGATCVKRFTYVGQTSS